MQHLNDALVLHNNKNEVKKNSQNALKLNKKQDGTIIPCTKNVKKRLTINKNMINYRTYFNKKDLIMTKTISAKPATIKRDWYLIDATDLVLGRLSSQIATILRGKNKTSYTPHMDCGDYVVVINADKVAFTGKKLEQKMYYHHTGYIGGIKGISAAKLMEKKPEDVIYKAVQRMISRNKLGRQMMTKLRVYAGAEHPHTAQNPIALDIASKNRKNKRSDV